MTALRVYILQCDHPGCIAEYRGGEFAEEARRTAFRRAGWVHGIQPRAGRIGPYRSVDYCAEHASDLPVGQESAGSA